MNNNDYQNEILKLKKQVERLKKSVKKQKYGLVWMDVPEAFEDDVENKLPILKEVPELAIKNDDGKPTHILIEGDNYHALTCLNYTHKGKIDVIYIDPPYNTGEGDFRYKDKRLLDRYPDGTEVAKDSPFRHSYWLSFMYKRIDLARNLLNDNGVLIAHIDENELHNFHLLLTEIFGSNNDLGIIIWNKGNPKGDSKGVSIMNEYVLVFANNKESFLSQDGCLSKNKENAEKILNKAKKLFSKLGKTQVPDEVLQILKPYTFDKSLIKNFEVKYDLDQINKDFQNWLKVQPFSGGEKAYKFIDENGKVYRGVSMAWPNKKKAPDDYFIPLIHPVTNKECPIPQRGWRYSLNSMKELLSKNLILFGDDETKQPERKYLLEENLTENTSSIYYDASSDDNLLSSLGIAFPYPKPLSTAKYLINSVHPDPKIVLDFFAGSGTTGHAVLEINNEKNKSIQFILATNNEDNILVDTCYPRIQKVINGYKDNNNGTKQRGLGGSLVQFKTAFVGKRNILNIKDEDKVELAHNAGELLALSENTLDLINKDDWMQLYENNDRYTAIYFREEMTNFEKFKSTVKKLDKPVSIYVFSWGDNEFPDDFAEIKDAKVKTIPAPILEIYKQIYNLNTK